MYKVYINNSYAHLKRTYSVFYSKNTETQRNNIFFKRFFIATINHNGNISGSGDVKTTLLLQWDVIIWRVWWARAGRGAGRGTRSKILGHYRLGAPSPGCEWRRAHVWSVARHRVVARARVLPGPSAARRYSTTYIPRPGHAHTRHAPRHDTLALAACFTHHFSYLHGLTHHLSGNLCNYVATPLA